MSIEQITLTIFILFALLAFIIDIGLEKATLGFNSKQEQNVFTIITIVVGILLTFSIIALCNSIINL